MSDEKLEILRRYFAHPGDLVKLFSDEAAVEEIRSTAGEFVHPEFHMPAGSSASSASDLLPTVKGTEGFIEAWRDMLVGWERLTSDIDELHEIDEDRVLALGTSRGRTKHGAVDVEIPTGAIYHFREGKLWRIEYFTTQADALEAAGMSE